MQDVGVRVGVQGEQQYRQSIQNIVQTSKELNAEMKALVSGFDETTSSQEQARQKMDVLNRQIQNQSKYIETLNAKYKAQESTLNTLKQQLDKANAEYGEGSKESQKLTTKIQQQETAMSKTRTAINNATTALNSMQSEMSQTESAASGAATQSDRLAEAIDDAGDAAERSKSGWSVLGQMVADFASNAMSAAISNIKALAKEAISVNDQMIKFQNTMQFAGFAADEIEQVSTAMKDYADRTVYSLGDVSNVVAQLAANGVDNFEELVEAAGNLNAAAGGSADTFSSFGLVLTQTAGAGKLTTENWKQLANAIPGASGKLQDALREAGAFTGDFAEAMKDGEITAEEFNAAILKIGTEPIAVEAATSATTFEAKLASLKTKGIDIISDALVILAPAIDLVFAAFDAILTPLAKLSEALKLGTDRVGQYTSASKLLTEAVRDWKAEQKELDDTYDSSAVLMSTYKGRLQEVEDRFWKLKAAGEDTKEVEAEYKILVDQLNESIPNLNLTISEQNGLLDGNSRRILNNADAWAEAQKQQIYQEQFTEILRKQAAAEVEVATNRARLKVATDNYNAAVERSAELQRQIDQLWDEYYSGAADDPVELKKRIEELTLAYEEENRKVGEATKEMNTYSEATSKSEDALESVTTECEYAKQAIEELANSQSKFPDAASEALWEVVPKYAQAARDASRAWNNNLSFKAWQPARNGFQTISAYKTGLAYVPYDGFIAELHKGERILTAAEALEYRNLRTPEITVPAAPVTPDLSTINNTNKTSVVLNVYGAEGQDEQALADIVMDRIQRSVNRQEALYA